MNEMQRLKAMNDMLLEAIKNKDAELVDLYYKNVMLQWENNELKSKIEQLEKTSIKFEYVGR
ncbi:hypothetical protein ABG79_02153 [Caloramator mitchellensis]|uniref:Uncharacterized protein n=1 Tax=Caloramator mitchellensis TaxID=908809 RepID=A0A0R3JZK2_CALMK|nr:hypothetical protein [Caloramator mitchellensis]KRQ86021.1 hypothetical protein ABG79_02153 [Caloramator mitchellensis]